MVRVNKNIKFVFSIIFIGMSVILSFLGFSNLKKMNSSYFNLTRENSSLIEKKSKTEEKLKVLKQDINSKHSKLDVIKNEIKKIDILKNKSQEIQNFNKEIGDSLIGFETLNFNNSYKISKDKINNFEVLKGNFIDKDLSYEDINSNLIVLPFIVNSNYNYALNREIGKHNIKSFQNLGLVNYLINGENYMLKSILLNDSSKASKLKDEKENILNKENNLLDISENIFDVDLSAKKNLKIDSKENQMNEEKTKTENEEDILNALCIDILNSSANYLKGFNIIKEDDLNKLKYGDKVLMTEKIEDNKVITNYYKGIDKEAYTISEEKE